MFDEYRFSGSLPENASTYVTREADEELYESLCAGKFCYVLNSRQTGKSSIRVRTMRRLRDAGVECAAIDLSAGGVQNVTPEQWYVDLIDHLIESFVLDVDLAQWWSKNQFYSEVTRFRKFIEEVLLVEVQEKIVIFIDEIDSVLSLQFPTDDFFALIRACHNQRVDNLDYNRLTFCLLGVASPGNLIQDKQRTPFNIGRAINLKGFQLHEVEPLRRGLDGKFSDSQNVMQDILNWTGGQPFLTQKLCYFMVEELQKDNPRSVEQVVRARIIENWKLQDEPEHLKTIRDRIIINEQLAGRLLGLYQQILQGGEIAVDDSAEQMKLHLTGIVVEQHNKLKVYNKIYASVFNLNWVERQFANLRPYAEALKAWTQSKHQDESRLLRGQALLSAHAWAKDKSLSDEDYRFLAASQECDKREVQSALDAEKRARHLEKLEASIALEAERKAKQVAEQANDILAEARQKAKNRRTGRRTRRWVSLDRKRKIAIILCVTCSIWLIRCLGFFQLFEWIALDTFFQLRPLETYPQPITIIAVDEISLRTIGTWPVPDRVVAELLTKLNKYQPRAIGLDIYRDFKVYPGHEQLLAAYQATSNLVGIEKLSQKQDNHVLPPIGLNPSQVGFNNIVLDSDAKVRRSLLYWRTYSEKHESFALKIAKLYLQSTGIIPLAAQSNPEYLQLGKAVFPRFLPNDGSYIGADNRGYQIISNFPKPSCATCSPDNWGFRKVSLREVLNDKVPENWIKDRIVLIGSTAPSLQDYVQIPYSSQFVGQAKTIAGVELQAYFISELISGALYSRPLIKVWSEGMELLCILAISCIGMYISWQFLSRLKFFICIVMLEVSLVVASYLVFLAGWWLPIIPFLLSSIVTIIVARIEIFHQLEMLRTLELIMEVYESNPAAAQIAIKYLKYSESKPNQILIEQLAIHKGSNGIL